MIINPGPIIHNGVVLHGISLAPTSQITYLVTNQAIIPEILPATVDTNSVPSQNNSENFTQ